MPFAKLLEDVSQIQAPTKPIEDGHSIWELVLHLITAKELIVDLMHGEMRPYEPGDEWPPVSNASAGA